MKYISARRGAVLLDYIWVSPNRRDFNPEKLAALAESMKDVGLLNPITVRIAKCVIDPEDGELEDVTALVAGRHRVEAARLLGWDRIECIYTEYDELHAELAEIDENLMRADLGSAQEATVVARRKAIYEELHPETKAGVAGGKARQRAASDNLSFAEATAQAVGNAKRTIERAAARGEALGRDLAEIQGTSLDKGVELDALVGMSASERADIIRRAKSGETVSARSSSASHHRSEVRLLEAFRVEMVERAKRYTEDWDEEEQQKAISEAEGLAALPDEIMLDIIHRFMEGFRGRVREYEEIQRRIKRLEAKSSPAASSSGRRKAKALASG